MSDVQWFFNVLNNLKKDIYFKDKALNKKAKEIRRLKEKIKNLETENEWLCHIAKLGTKDVL